VQTANGENQLVQFRQRLYHKHLNKRKNTQVSLIDALCSHIHKGSVVELSLNPVFQPGYSALYKGITDYQPEKAKLPMHQYPFTLVLIRIYDAQGELRYPNDPLWLIVLGRERQQLSLTDIYEAFSEREGMEQFFRFSKRNLLLDKFQTPETEHEENWWQIVCLAYLQLWAAKDEASNLPRPWERYLPQVRKQHLSPTMVQRSFAGIIRQFGTPVNSPQPRNKSPGSIRGKAPA
jgi:hypothetical protein